MPGFDRTGPIGYGPLTGRGLGPCGCGFRRGRGFGWRYTESIALTKDEQKRILEAELKDIEAEKQEIAKKLSELKK